MTTKIAINGFGRIGRCVTRALFERGIKDLELVGINDLTDAETLAHLLEFDSVHGHFDTPVAVDGSGLNVGGKRIPISAERDPKKLPWKALGVDVVLECTGLFRDKTKASAHLEAGASRVIISAPGGNDIDGTFCVGINTDTLTADHRIISNASCTTNCLAPMAKVLHEEFGIVRGLMNTIHAYTNDQVILDLPHKDLRRARSAGQNIIPTTTGAARAVGKVLPALAGKLDGFAVRVPVPDGSLVDLTAVLEREVTKDQVNAAMKKASEGSLKALLRYSEDPIVSSDIIGDTSSCVFDSLLTMASGTLVKVCGWYDNEVGYSARCLDLLARMALQGS